MTLDLAMYALGVASLGTMAGCAAHVFRTTDWRRVIATARGQFLVPGASVASPPPCRSQLRVVEAAAELTLQVSSS